MYLGRGESIPYNVPPLNVYANSYLQSKAKYVNIMVAQYFPFPSLNMCHNYHEVGSNNNSTTCKVQVS